jgi:hypothetical protein
MRRALVTLLLAIAAAGCVATPIPLPLTEGGVPVGKLDVDRSGDFAVKGPDGGGPQLHMDAMAEGDDGRDGGGGDGLSDGAADAGGDGRASDGLGPDGLPPTQDGLAPAQDGLAPPAPDGPIQKKDGP